MKIKIALILVVCLQMILCATSQKRIAKSQETDPRYQYKMGLYYLNSSQLDLSIKHLKKALSLEPQNHLALNALGLSYLKKGIFDESVKYFTECLKINPSLTEAQNNLGVVYQELGLLDKAEEFFTAASLDTQFSSREHPFYNLARLYFIQNKLQDALFQVQKSLEIKQEIIPDDIDLNFNLAEAYFNNRQFEKAKQLFNTLYLQSIDMEMKKKIEDYLRKIKQLGFFSC